MSKVILFNRKTKEYTEEQVFEKKLMHFLYKTRIGLVLTNLIFKRRWVSKVYSLIQKSKASKKKINEFIKMYNIDINEIKRPIEDFKDFNEFFIRELKEGARSIVNDPNILISPCDSKINVYNITNDTIIPVKGLKYTIKDLIGDESLAKEFENGVCIIFRLSVYDYHRFCYFDDGVQEKVKSLGGYLYSVSPISIEQNLKVHHGNYREYCVLNTNNFGKVLQIEVGATLVGKIVQKFPQGTNFVRGQEKGYFEFGGSTVILLFKENIVNIDEDIMENSIKGIETIVKLGEKIGCKISKS